MKKILLTFAVLGLAALGWWWATRAPYAPVAAIVVPTATAAAVMPSLATGLISAGAQDTIPARVQGRIKHVYFDDKSYAHRGDVLVKLTNYSFIIAPHDGFLGTHQVEVGQYVGATTPITTISRRPALVVAVAGAVRGLHPGDSVRVWVATRPDRVAMGQVGLAAGTRAGAAPALEVVLGPGAPFRIGESACVGRAVARQPAVRETAPVAQ